MSSILLHVLVDEVYSHDDPVLPAELSVLAGRPGACCQTSPPERASECQKHYMIMLMAGTFMVPCT